MIAGLQGRPLWRRGLAALTLSSYVLLLALAACPALHELIHHDAGRPDHDCAVTTVLKDHVVNDLPPVLFVSAPGLFLAVVAAPAPPLVDPACPDSHVLEHAPPTSRLLG